MEKTLHIKPAEGLRVRDPDRRDHLPPEGRLVPSTQYWLHRLRDADVVMVPHVLEKIVTKSPDATAFNESAKADDKVDAEVKKASESDSKKPVVGDKV